MDEQALIAGEQNNYQFVIIWLHGMGASGYDFKPLIPKLNLPDDHQIKFIFPHASERPVTINNGITMPAWFDIKTFQSIESDIDIKGINEAIHRVHKLIQNEINQGIASSRIMLAGFSQGGVIALYAALQWSYCLGGIIALSTYMPAWSHFKSHIRSNPKLPILLTHGENDPLLPVDLSRITQQQLQTEGFDVTYRTYPMAHEICLDEINLISKWITKQFQL